jgi:hypothetical protein
MIWIIYGQTMLRAKATKTNKKNKKIKKNMET